MSLEEYLFLEMLVFLGAVLFLGASILLVMSGNKGMIVFLGDRHIREVTPTLLIILGGPYGSSLNMPLPLGQN
jgi:hypothetical protein